MPQLNTEQILPQDKKLTVQFRIEPGSLGPEGINHIEAFCQFAQNNISLIDSNFIHWTLIPRYDKSLAEIEFKISSKILTRDQAARYLHMLNRNLDQLEEQFHDRLAQLIEQFMQGL